MLENFDLGIIWEESIPNEEDKFHEGPELDILAVTGALGVFARPEAEVEYQLDKVGNMSGFGVGGAGRCGHDRMDNVKRGGIFLFDRRVLDAIGFHLMGEAYVQSNVCLGVWRISGIRENIQEAGP